jgi:AMMECR1 domain-containing protein
MVYNRAMKRRPTERDWLPLARPPRAAAGDPTGEAFRCEWIDFERGIRVGHLEPHERITQILKFNLERRHGTVFVIDRWGRGVYWQWICWLPKANRQAKLVSGGVNFGCAKLFISVDRGGRVFQSGLQVERGQVKGSAYPGTHLEEDWDWHRLLEQCRKGSELDRELARLIASEGFVAEIGDFENNLTLDRGSFTSATQLAAAARGIAPDRFGGFQLYYPMPSSELRGCSGFELVKAVLAVFAEVTPAMNLCMQVPLAVPRSVQAPRSDG